MRANRIVNYLLEADFHSDTEKEALRRGTDQDIQYTDTPDTRRLAAHARRAKDMFQRRQNASHGSLEGAPLEDPGVMNSSEWPRTPGEAREKGLSWHIPSTGRNKGRQMRTTLAEPDAVPHYRNSEKIARTRNQRRQSYGYKDTYSLRDRGWPTGGQWTKWDKKRKQAKELPVDEPPFEVP